MRKKQQRKNELTIVCASLCKLQLFYYCYITWWLRHKQCLPRLLTFLCQCAGVVSTDHKRYFTAQKSHIQSFFFCFLSSLSFNVKSDRIKMHGKYAKRIHPNPNAAFPLLCAHENLIFHFRNTNSQTLHISEAANNEKRTSSTKDNVAGRPYGSSGWTAIVTL